MSKPPLHALNGIGDFGTTTRPQLVLLRIDPSSPLCLFTRFCFILLPVPDPDAQPLACFLFSSFSDMRGRPLTALWPAPFLVSPFFWSAVRSPSVTGRVTEYESADRQLDLHPVPQPKPDLANSMTAAAFFLPKDLGHKTCHWLALLLLRFLSRCPFAPAPHFGPCTYCDRALPSPRSHLSPRATLSSGFLPLPICPFLSLYPLM